VLAAPAQARAAAPAHPAAAHAGRVAHGGDGAHDRGGHGGGDDGGGHARLSLGTVSLIRQNCQVYNYFVLRTLNLPV
jgi:hypothetical protein